jgi:gliding motility-associated-like protein
MPPTFRFKLLLLFTCCFISNLAYTAPGNDNCNNALPINISGGGYSLNTFTSATINMSGATLQAGEVFPYINNPVSVWFKFTIPTKRSVNITLYNPSGNLPTGTNPAAAGFTIYSDSTCLPVQHLASQTGLGANAQRGFGCLAAGTYLIQVCSDNSYSNVTPNLYVSLVVGPPDGIYDFGDSASVAGTLINPVTQLAFPVGCQSIDSSQEYSTCLPLGANAVNYTQSTWHTFTTGPCVDYLGIFLGKTTHSPAGTTTIGYRLYQGNVISQPGSLTLVNACDTFVYGGIGNNAQINNLCDLLPNTPYTLQLLYPQDFVDSVSLSIRYLGSGITHAPEPVLNQMNPDNILGTLSGNSSVSVSDYFSCSSQLSDSSHCGTVNPTTGFNHDGYTYNLCTWYTFKTTTYLNIHITANMAAPFSNNIPVYVRIFNDSITNNCNSIPNTPLTSFNNSYSLNCLPPGNYSFQIMGVGGLPNVWDSTQSQFGRPVKVNVTWNPPIQNNTFNLSSTTAFNGINNSQPLSANTIYSAINDQFGCDSTVLPSGALCGGDTTVRAIYRQFVVGADSGVLFINNLAASMDYMLYTGNASALATTENVNHYPQAITGLTPYSVCLTDSLADYMQDEASRFCITPGTYTFATLGGYEQIGLTDQPSFQIRNYTTTYNSPANVENMGTISLTQPNISNVDYFSCIDNLSNICGGACSGYTKAIYRQFYLPTASFITITNAYDGNYVGSLSLYNGQANAISGPVTSTQSNWQCSDSLSTATCETLPAGWYTLISFGTGPSYTSPAYINGSAGNIGDSSKIEIIVTPDTLNSLYNLPGKACIANNGNPLNWYLSPFVVTPPQYPYNDQTYNLCTDHFSCKTDTPFSSGLIACADSTHGLPDETLDRVSYYTFKLAKESFVVIYNTYPARMAKVYNFDVRTADSAFLATVPPIQPCLSSAYYIELCKMQPGTYTLVLFGGYAEVGAELTPLVYVDSVNYSRFDNAVNAYDFDRIPGDNTYRGGKLNDINPINPARAASHDFFFCTTGAQLTDPPWGYCSTTVYDTLIYPAGRDTINYPLYLQGMSEYAPRRNLWYTFLLQGKGECDIQVRNMWPGNDSSFPYAVYVDNNVNATLPFSTLQTTTGGVDSILAGQQGGNLQLVASNDTLCSFGQQVSFSICETPQTINRYYILVDDPFYPWPDQQVEVWIKFDSITVLYDHYFQANIINGLGQTGPSYTAQNLGYGTYNGATASLICTTEDQNDQNTCGRNTIWYSFTTTESGVVNVGFSTDGGTTVNFDTSDIILMKQTVAGDSTANGLNVLPLDSSTNGVNTYGQTCLSPGTYYILITGCSSVFPAVTPVVVLQPNLGDSCNLPVARALSGPGNVAITATVTCHTMGGDFQEDTTSSSCMPNPQGYKSSWLRFDLTDPTQKYDLNFNLTSTVPVLSTDIPCRVLGGDCDNMIMYPTACGYPGQIFSLTCMASGSYYIQVYTPIGSAGTVTMNITATITQDPNCNPVTSNFIYKTYCGNDSVQFTNYSPQGNDFIYSWNFGFANDTSNLLNPFVLFPASNVPVTYQVKLTVTDTVFSATNDTIIPVTIYPVTVAVAGTTQAICLYDSATITASGGISYLWSDAETAGTITVGPAVSQSYSVTATDTVGCTASSSVNISVKPLAYSNPVVNICQGDSFMAGGAYQQISGTYYDTTNAANGCDSFITTQLIVHPLQYTSLYDTICQGQSLLLAGAQQTVTGTYVDTLTSIFGCDSIITTFLFVAGLPPANAGPGDSVCFGTTTTFNATGGLYFIWSNGDSTSTDSITASQSQWYTVTVSDGRCQASDSTYLTVYPLPQVSIAANPLFCFGDSDRLTALGIGSFKWFNNDTLNYIYVNQPGSYTVTITDVNGCMNSVADTVIYYPLINVSFDTIHPLCYGNNNGEVIANTTGGFITSGLNYNWTDSSGQNMGNTSTAGNLSAGEYYLTITDNAGCTKTDSVLLTQPDSLKIDSAKYKNITCYEYANGTITLFVSGGTLPVLYSDNNGSTFQPAAMFDSLAPGNYPLLIKDSNNCQTSHPYISITQPGPIEVYITADVHGILHFGDTVHLRSNYNSVVALPVISNWKPDYYLNCDTCANIAAQPLTNTTYTLMIEDSNGCYASNTYTVYVDSNDKLFFVPNAFTPNGDGNNDVFRIYAAGVGKVDCYIFDRWGEEVDEFHNMDDGWDGNYKGHQAPLGVYVYWIDLVYLDGTVEHDKGSVTLIR